MSLEKMIHQGLKVIALEARLKDCKNVVTLGVKPNFSDYGFEESELIRKAKKVYYPTGFYADLFDAAGKTIFPSYHTYKFSQDKIKQTAVFDILNIPHPRTRVFMASDKSKRSMNILRTRILLKSPGARPWGVGFSDKKSV
jgi:ribosomal protein S6--L-glutamate ligase